MKATSKIALGTVQFGIDYGISNVSGKTPDHSVPEILSVAQQHGIVIIDTAPSYGNAETVLGQNDLRPFKMVSKFFSSQVKSLQEQLSSTLDHLNVKKLYGYLAHRPQQMLDCPHEWHDLKKMQEAGWVEKIGFSFNTCEELESVVFKKGWIPDLVQVPFNYFDDRFESALVKLKELGVEVHTRSAFLQGLFFCDPNTLDTFFKPVQLLIDQLQRREGQNLSCRLLQYCLHQEFIDFVVMGVNTVEQLQQNLKAESEKVLITKQNFKIPSEILSPFLWPQK